MMKLIRCILGPADLPAFLGGMVNLTSGMTVWESRRHGGNATQNVSYRGVGYEVAPLSITVEIVSDESWVDDIIRKILEAHRQDEFHVRALYVFPVEESYHIRGGFMD